MAALNLLAPCLIVAALSQAAIVEYCKHQGALAVFSAVLVDKQDARLEGGLPASDFCGLKIDNHYVFGYGMDYKGYLRNAPGIYVVAPEHESS